MNAKELLAHLMHRPAAFVRRPKADAAASADEANRRTLHRRAVEAAIWGMPLVSFAAMREAFFRDAGANYGDLVYLSKPADWRFQITTPSASALYVYFNFNTKEGPVVLDVPASGAVGLFGSVLDAWQTPLADVGPNGEDEGHGGKYLLLPPGYDGQIPEGHLPLRAATYNGYGVLRVIPATHANADIARAIELIKQLRVYRHGAASPTTTRYIDIAGKPFDAIPSMDESFYEALARLVGEEPVQARDLVAMAQLRALGIEKDRTFAPNSATRTVLRAAIREAHATFKREAASCEPFWSGSHWCAAPSVGQRTGFSFMTSDHLEVDERGMVYFLACAPPQRLGAATFYLGGFADADGAALSGEHRYRLHVPADVPVEQYWAATVYDLETAGLVRQAPKLAIDSYQQTQKNADGSLDIYFGPSAPVGRESNWVYTAPGKPWFTFFRFYGPKKAVFDRTWRLGEIERISGATIH